MNAYKDRVGFEPTESCPSAAFKAAALVHYAISPYGIIRGAHPKAQWVERGTEPHLTPMCPPMTQRRGSSRLRHLRGKQNRTRHPFGRHGAYTESRGERRGRCPIRGTRDSFAAATRNVHTTTSQTVHATSPISSRHPSTRTRRRSARRRRSPGILHTATRPPHNADPTTRRKAAHGLLHTAPGAIRLRSMLQAPGADWTGPSDAAPP